MWGFVGLMATERLDPPEQIDARAARGTNDRPGSAETQPTLIGQTTHEHEEPTDEGEPPREPHDERRGATGELPPRHRHALPTQIRALSTTDEQPPRLGDPAS